MNVWLFQIGELLPLSSNSRKMRTMLLAESLLQRGHSVVWWASAFEHLRKKMLFEKDTDINLTDKFTIKALRGVRYKRNISIMRYIDHRIIAFKFSRLASKMRPPDIIVASMPTYDLVYEALKFARKRNIPIIVDIRDLWPDIFWERLPPKLKWVAKLLLARDTDKVKRLLRGSTGLVAVSNGYLQWGLGYADREKNVNDKVFYLGYKKVEEVVSLDSNYYRELQKLKDKKVLLFIGTLGVSYELQLVIEAAKRFIDDDEKDVHFVIAGFGDQYEDIKNKAASLPNVSLTGMLNANEIAQLLAVGYIGMVPCSSAMDTMPNKPYEYLSAGLPIVSSLEGEMADIINEKCIGINYSAGNEESLYHALKTLVDNEALYRKMSNNALYIFNERFNAENIYEEYAGHIEGFLT